MYSNLIELIFLGKKGTLTMESLNAGARIENAGEQVVSDKRSGITMESLKASSATTPVKNKPSINGLSSRVSSPGQKKKLYYNIKK